MSFAYFLVNKLLMQIVAILLSTNSSSITKRSHAHINEFVHAPILIAQSEMHVRGLGLSIAVPVLEHIHPRVDHTRHNQYDEIPNPFSCIPITYLPFSFPLYMHLCTCTTDTSLQSRISQDSMLILDAIPELLPARVRNWIPSERHKRAEIEIMEAHEGGERGTRLLVGPGGIID